VEQGVPVLDNFLQAASSAVITLREHSSNPLIAFLKPALLHAQMRVFVVNEGVRNRELRLEDASRLFEQIRRDAQDGGFGREFNQLMGLPDSGDLTAPRIPR